MKRFAKTIISIAALGMCFSLAACGDSQPAMSDFERQTREIYESGLREGSIQDLTYEEWLESIKGQDGKDGKDGHTPVVTIGDNGHWYIDGVDTGISAQGPKGDQGNPGKDGVSIVSIELTSSSNNIDTYTITYSDGHTSIFKVTNGVDGSQGIQGEKGGDGHTPVIKIGSDGHWYVDDVDTGISAQGPKGDQGPQGEQGQQGPEGPQGPQGETGADGSSVLTGKGVPSTDIGENGDSFIDLDSWDFYIKVNNVWVKQGNIKGADGQQGPQGEQGAQGETGATGANGQTPYIGDNGNWWIGDTDTQVKAAGTDGISITSVVLIEAQGSGGCNTYEIHFSNGSSYQFYVYNGNNGNDGEPGKTPFIGENGHWWIGDIDTWVPATGATGEAGQTPRIGENGHWWIGEHDTGIDAQGPKGEQGDKGIDGTSLLSGYGAPSNDIGKQGDTYFDYLTGDIYKKGDKIWQEVGSVKGPQGEQGLNVYSNVGAPEPDLGRDGEMYVDVGNWDIYVKSNGYWYLRGNIKGDQGEAGVATKIYTNSIDPDSSQGEQGDIFINTLTGDLYEKYDGIWYLRGNIKGVQGEEGTQIFAYHQVPTSEFGRDNDLWINLLTGDLYKKSNGEWVSYTNLKGPKGDQGVSITSTYIDENGDLIVEFSNGNTTNAGHIKDVTTYTVNFWVDDDLIATREVLKDTTVSRPTDEETAGYTINGWYLDDLGNQVDWIFDGYFAYTVHDNIDLHAKNYSCNQYEITFSDPTFGNVVDSLLIEYDHEYHLPIISHEGYTFSGWKDENDNLWSDDYYRIPASINLTAVWNANTYTVSLNPNGGSVDSSSINVIYDTAYTLPIPTRLNYIFLGWYDGDNRISNSATWKLSSNKVLTAKWTNVTNTYVFDAGDGQCEIESMIIGWEDEYTLPTPTLSLFGYTFDAWYLDDTRIELTGTWTYSNTGGTLVARFVDNATMLVINSYGVLTGVVDKNITELIIPETVTMIGSTAFSGCSSLRALNIPETVTQINNNAFSDCSSLGTVNYYGTIESWLSLNGKEYLKSNIKIHLFLDGNNYETTSIVVPNDVTRIKSYAFRNCSSLISIKLSDSLTSIEHHAFYNCYSLTSIEIPEGVTGIGDYAFYQCYRLVEVINKSSLSIGKGSGNGFAGLYSLQVIHDESDSKLYTDNNGFITYVDGDDVLLISYIGKETSISVPNNVIKIHKYAFYLRSSLTSITLSPNVSLIDEYSFYGCSSLPSIEIPEGVTEIGAYAFYLCSSLTSITFPDNVASIGEHAFVHCTSLTTVTFGDNVGRIYNNAFAYCTSLTTVTFGNSVVKIYENVFSNCSNLSVINFGGTQSKWNSITKDANWNKSVPYLVVHCTDGDVIYEQ